MLKKSWSLRFTADVELLFLQWGTIKHHLLHDRQFETTTSVFFFPSDMIMCVKAHNIEKNKRMSTHYHLRPDSNLRLQIFLSGVSSLST